MTTPPVAPRRPHQHARITGDISDPYAWLVNKDDPATISYLEVENTFADRWFAPHQATVDAIFAEIKARTKEDDSAPLYKKESTGTPPELSPEAHTPFIHEDSQETPPKQYFCSMKT